MKQYCENSDMTYEAIKRWVQILTLLVISYRILDKLQTPWARFPPYDNSS